MPKQKAFAKPARAGSTVGHGGYAHANSTYAKITFHTWEDLMPTVYGWALPGDELFGGRVATHSKRPRSLVGSIVAFQTSKSISAPSGQWSITAKGRVHGDLDKGGRPWGDVLTDGDWVSINVVKNGVELHVMCGRLDTVAVSVTAGGTGEPSVTVTLTGRDLGASAEDTPVYFNPFDPLHNNLGGIEMAKLFGSTSKLAGKPHEIVPSLLVTLAAAGVSYGHPPQVPSGVFDLLGKTKWSSHIDHTSRVGETRGQIIVTTVLNQSTNASLWAFATQYQNPVMNEMWLDTDVDGLSPHKPYLHFRERPYVNVLDLDRSPWFDLPMHAVSCTTVRAVNLSRGKNRLNHLQVVGAFSGLFGSDGYPLFPPAYNVASIERWGLRRQEFNVPYFAEADGSASNVGQDAEQWRNLVLSWNVLNARHWSGIVALGEMRPEIRVGAKIALVDGPPGDYEMFPQDGGNADKAMTFYVEAVQHSWQAGQTPTAQTQLLVTRGYPEDQRVSDTLSAWSDWTDVGTPTSGADGTLGDYPEPDITGGVLA